VQRAIKNKKSRLAARKRDFLLFDKPDFQFVAAILDLLVIILFFKIRFAVKA
jgi:hypothetical protein